MNNDINLLDFKNKLPTKEQTKTQKYLRIAAIVLLFLVSSLTVIFFILIALSPLPELKKQYKKATDTLSLSNDEIIKQEITKERFAHTKEIIDKRTDFENVLEFIEQKLPPGVSIAAAGIEKNNISIIVSSASLLPLDNFIEAITDSDSSRFFSNVSMKDLSNKENENAFNLTLILKML